MLGTLYKIIEFITDTAIFYTLFALIALVAFLLNSISFAIVCHSILLITQVTFNYFYNKSLATSQPQGNGS